MIRHDLATKISKVSPLETPKQSLTRSKDLSICVCDTFDYYAKLVDIRGLIVWLLLGLMEKVGKEKKNGEIRK